uniref:SH3 domain-containing protein 19-like n=1 Tax=Saccoglossus kowalevskii TaxID=10224 RepID=A0ABM0MK50_SACKO|nr:PREDICTED: SH3 domain-containing protein 19-like [Saccoglossus kowalevskii]
MAEATTEESSVPPPPRRPTIIRAGATPTVKTLENGDDNAPPPVVPLPPRPTSLPPPPIVPSTRPTVTSVSPLRTPPARPPPVVPPAKPTTPSQTSPTRPVSAAQMSPTKSRGGRPEITIISARPMSECPQVSGSSLSHNDANQKKQPQKSVTSSSSTPNVPPPLPANRTSSGPPPPLPSSRPSHSYVHPIVSVPALVKKDATPKMNDAAQNDQPPVPVAKPLSQSSKAEPIDERGDTDPQSPLPAGAVSSVGPPLPVRPKTGEDSISPPPPVPPLPTAIPKSASNVRSSRVFESAPEIDKSTAPALPPHPKIATKPPPLSAKPNYSAPSSVSPDIPPPVTNYTQSKVLKPSPSPSPEIFSFSQSFNSQRFVSSTPPPGTTRQSITPSPVATRPNSTPPVISCKPVVATKPSSPSPKTIENESSFSQFPSQTASLPQEQISAQSAGGMFGVMLRPTIGPSVEEPSQKKSQSPPSVQESQFDQDPFSVPFSSSQKQQQIQDPFKNWQSSGTTAPVAFDKSTVFTPAPSLTPKPTVSAVPVFPSSSQPPPPVPTSRPRPKPSQKPDSFKSDASSELTGMGMNAPPPVPISRPRRKEPNPAAWQPSPAYSASTPNVSAGSGVEPQKDMNKFIKDIESLYSKAPSPVTVNEQPENLEDKESAIPIITHTGPTPAPTTRSASSRPTIIRPSAGKSRPPPRPIASPTSGLSSKSAPPPRPSGGPTIHSSSSSSSLSLLDSPIPETEGGSSTNFKSSSSSSITRSQSMRTAPARPDQPKKKAPAPPRPPPAKMGDKPSKGAPARSQNKTSTGAKPKSGPPLLPARPGPGHPLFKYVVTEPHAIAVFSYSKQNYDELSFDQDEVIILVKKVDDDWLIGRNVDEEGMFPKKFVRIIKPLPSESAPRLSGPSAVAVYDYDSVNPDDLNFNNGDVIKLLQRIGDDWYKGECNGEIGMFPKNFVEVVEDLPEYVEETQVDWGSGPRCRARFDYEGEEENDLEFDEGEIIKLISYVDEEWLKGEVNGKIGIFPIEFVEIIEDLPPSKAGVLSQATGITVTPPTPTNQDNYVSALYDFEGSDNTELSFKAGDRIQVVSQVNADWLIGKIFGSSGRFPSAFVDQIPPNLPVEDKSSSGASDAHCIAKYDYDVTAPTDLSFKEGDKIVILENVNDEWLRGKCKGEEGMFPKVFVDVITELPPESKAGGKKKLGGAYDELIPKAKALYDFSGQSDSELTFKAGDIIYLLNNVTEEWCNGEIDGNVGQFPLSFVEILIPLP